MSEDPADFLGGDVNLYAYVWGTPTKYVDPLGYGIIGFGIDWVASKALSFPKFPVLVFLPWTAFEVATKGPCVTPQETGSSRCGLCRKLGRKHCWR